MKARIMTATRCTSTSLVGVVAIALLGAALRPPTAAGQGLPLRHGGEITKQCPAGPITVGNPFTCNITFANRDTFNDTLNLANIVDQVMHASGTLPFDLIQGPFGPNTEMKGGCFNGDAATNFFARPVDPAATPTCALPNGMPTDSDCGANGVCITGACLGGTNNPGGFCRPTPSCPAGQTCKSSVCFSGGVPTTTPCCDCPGGTCKAGHCGPEGACCDGGDNDRGRCCECGPNVTCAQGFCSNSSTTACTTDANCPGGSCIILLPPEGTIAVTRTDTVQAGDEQLPGSALPDLATATGVDQGTLLSFSLNIPAAVVVQPTTTTTLPPGCRITGGGTVNGVLDPNAMAEITKAQFAGQVGAPCGCFGCFDKFDPKLASVQGEWKHQRKNKGGSLHANTFNSLVCSCLGGAVGELCPDAAPPRTPADHICITGTGQFIPDTGNGNKNPIPVAFRFEATDRGEPGTNDFYEMHIFTPTAAGQTVEDLAKSFCCTKPPVFPITGVIANDSGLLVAGNIQIHRALAKSTDGPCPPPSGVCMPLP